MNVGPFIRKVMYEYASIVFCYTVTMNFQQSSSRPFFIFQQLTATPAINCDDFEFCQFLQQSYLLLMCTGKTTRPTLDFSGSTPRITVCQLCLIMGSNFMHAVVSAFRPATQFLFTLFLPLSIWNNKNLQFSLFDKPH